MPGHCVGHTSTRLATAAVAKLALAVSMMLDRPELPVVSSATMTQHASQVPVGMKGCVRLPQTTNHKTTNHKPQTTNHKPQNMNPKPQTTKPKPKPRQLQQFTEQKRDASGETIESSLADAAQECSHFQHFGCHGSGSGEGGDWTHSRGVLPNLQRSAWVCEQHLKHTRRWQLSYLFLAPRSALDRMRNLAKSGRPLKVQTCRGVL